MLAAARAIAQADGVDEICIIGGAQLYEATLPLADRVILTEVDLTPDGDARFPALGADWREISSKSVARGPKDDADFVVRVLERHSEEPYISARHGNDPAL
jgi:dihydrofolate reductase